MIGGSQIHVYVFYTDGDGQYDPSELRDLVKLMGPLVGLVNGYKLDRTDPWHRVAIGWTYNRFARYIFDIQLRDIDCDFRLIKRSVLDQLVHPDRFADIVVHAGRQAAIAVRVERAVAGEAEDRRAPRAALAGANRLGRAVAVERRHVRVHQDQVPVLVLGQLDRDAAVGRDLDVVAHAIQRALGDEDLPRFAGGRRGDGPGEKPRPQI